MEDSKDDARRAKKSIQYDNYRTQKKEEMTPERAI